MAISKITKSPTPTELVKKVNELLDAAEVGKNTLQRNTAYNIGDIAYSSLLPSWARLECIQAGSTSNTQPEWSFFFQE